MNNSGTPLLEGSFTVCTVLSLPKTNLGIVGKVSFVSKGGQTVVASFMFADGYRIVAGKDVPVFATGRHGFVYVGESLVALVVVRSRFGTVLVAWGTKKQYDEAVAETEGRVLPAEVGVVRAPLTGIDARLRRTLRISPGSQKEHRALLATGQLATTG